MPEIGTSGSMSGDGKRSVAAWPKLPRPSSTLPEQRSFGLRFMPAIGGEPSVAVTTERGARRRHGCRTYGLDEGRHGNQRDDRENSGKLLHDTSPRRRASKQRPYEVNVSVNLTRVSISFAYYPSV